MKKILIIDDEIQIIRLLKISLQKKDFGIYEATTGFSGLQQVEIVRPDLILLDLNLPDMDGREVLEKIRVFRSIPVIIVSVRNAEEDIVALLNAGADDYIIKPFHTLELIARVNAAIRRLHTSPDELIIKTGELCIDLEERRITARGQQIKMTPIEYSIMQLLVQNLGKIITQERILKEVWGPLHDAEYGSLRVHIASLRKKIEKNPAHPEFLITEPGIGYRLCIKNPPEI